MTQVPTALSLSGTSDLASFVFAANDEIKTTSLLVAENFGKLHKHVLRDIERIISQTAEMLNAPKFGLVDYLDAKGESRKMYEMNQDGLVLVVMAYTGEKAMQIKVAYINAFNMLWEQLFGQDHQFRANLEAAPDSYLITEAEKILGLKFMGLFQILNGFGYIFKRGKSKWMCTKKGIESGVVEQKITHKEYSGQVHLTALGLSYFNGTSLLLA